jgi:DNA-binding beta-propeller fold protein YncE
LVWVAHETAARRGELVSVEPGGRRTGAPVAVGREPVAIAVGFGAVWVADRGADAVLRVDPVRRRRVASVPVGRDPAAVAAAGGRIWVAAIGDRTLTAIDPATNEPVGAPVRLGKEIEDLAGRGEAIWVAAADGTVTRLDARRGVVTGSVATLRAPLSLAVEPRADGVWVGSVSEQRVARISVP